jgi:hypothetical protein
LCRKKNQKSNAPRIDDDDYGDDDADSTSDFTAGITARQDKGTESNPWTYLRFAASSFSSASPSTSVLTLLASACAFSLASSAAASLSRSAFSFALRFDAEDVSAGKSALWQASAPSASSFAPWFRRRMSGHDSLS